MAFPNDQTMREKYLAVRYGRLFLDTAKDSELDNISMPTSMLELLLSSPVEGDILVASHQSTVHGSIAGEILLFLLEMQAGEERPSINKAIHLAEDYFSRAADAAGKKPPTSDRTLRAAWSRFANVAHLWAANCLLVSTMPREAAIQKWTDEPMHVLAIAHDLLRKASAIKSSHGREALPILPADRAWVLPSAIQLPVANCVVSGLQEWQKTRLSGYSRVSKLLPD